MGKIFYQGGQFDKTGYLLNLYADQRAYGNVFFVCSAVTGATDSAGYGQSPDAPFATIAYAIGKCTANNDDLILVLPGHTETCIAAGTVTVNKAGVTIRGCTPGGAYAPGWGRKAVVNYTTAAAASFDITAANVTIDNLCFTPIGVDAVTAAINVSAADVAIVNCEFELANSTNQAALGILTTASANRLFLSNNVFHGTADAGTTAAVQIVGGDSIRIYNNTMKGAYTSGTGGLSNITTASTNLEVYGNTILNYTASSTKAFTAVSGTTGFHQGNSYGILSGTAPFTAAGMYTFSNIYAAAVATTGTAC